MPFRKLKGRLHNGTFKAQCLSCHLPIIQDVQDEKQMIYCSRCKEQYIMDVSDKEGGELMQNQSAHDILSNAIKDNVKVPILWLSKKFVFEEIPEPQFLKLDKEHEIQRFEEILEQAEYKLPILIAAVCNLSEEGPPNKAENLVRVGTGALITDRPIKKQDGYVVTLLGISKVQLSYEDDLFKLATLKMLKKIPLERNEEAQGLFNKAVELSGNLVAMGAVGEVALKLLSRGRALESMPEKTFNLWLEVILYGLNAGLCQAGVSFENKIAAFVELSANKRLEIIVQMMEDGLEYLLACQRTQQKAEEEGNKQRKEYMLRQVISNARKELGEDEKDEAEDLMAKIEAANLPENVFEAARKQVKRLGSAHSSEADVIRTYLNWIIELPWDRSTEDNLDIKHAFSILEEDHYDLEKVKERILEYLAVRQLNPGSRGPILCLVGPPGVGKTSLGKSIARAMGRKFVRISLGGIRDEAEVRGHRRTYIGALPGRIIQGIRDAGSNNPIFMLDEIDKVGADHRGDPSSALLEALDPEQNSAFSDHYLGQEIPFDLSKVMFIATGNLADPILPALKDRLEIINIPGYTDYDKCCIARGFLIPRQFKENGLQEDQLNFPDEAVKKIITHYTREAGVRNLEREIGSVCRKVVRKIVEGTEGPFSVSASDVHKYLGAPKFLPDTEMEEPQVGVANGLAWTAVGGEILKVEVKAAKGKERLILTGQLGEVMRESAQAARTWLKTHASILNIDEKRFREEVHIHVPSGAIPKEGPSAGIAIVVAMASVYTGFKVRSDIAMTGEITLRGRLLNIGGVKEKALAAYRAGIKKIVLPHENEKDIEDIPSEIRNEIEFIFCKEINEALNHTLIE